MKKIVWLIILLLIPFMVGAEGKDLYKDLRQNAISNNQLQKIDDNVYIFKGGTSNNLANYVRFNNELWRIVGIYNNQLKIIHANSIGRHQFDDGSMKITYPDSELSVYLNGSYLNSINANDKSMIDENGKWYVGYTDISSKAAAAYTDAKKETLTEIVGIMATYEFLYASNGDNCYNVNGNSYSSSCGKSLYDWLTPAEHDAWTLTTYYYNEEHTRGVPLNISPSGYVSSGSGNAASLWIYPALYLKTNTKLVRGTGTSADPYILGLYYANPVNVEEKEGIDSIDFEIDDLTEVEYETEVEFSVKALKGYKIKDIKIVNNNNEEIEYTNTNGKYTFTMPKSAVTIKPTFEKVKSKIIVEKNDLTKNIDIKVDDVNKVPYKDEVVFVITPEKGYEIESITIIDEDKNTIEYTKNKNENEYTFVMPYSDVTISLKYIRAYRFIEGMGQKFDVLNDSRLRFRVNMEYKDFINGGKVYIDNKEVDSKYYELSEGSTIIIFSDEYSKKLSLGEHEIVTTLSDGSSCSTDFTIKEDTFGKKVNSPKTGDKIILVLIILLCSLGIYIYVKYKKVKKITS